MNLRSKSSYFLFSLFTTHSVLSWVPREHHTILLPYRQAWWFRCLYWCPAVSAQLCSNVMRKMPIKTAQEPCSLAAWFKLDTCMKWLKNRFSKPKDNKRTVHLIYISRGQKKSKRTTETLLILAEPLVKIHRGQERKTVCLWYPAICTASQYFSYLSSHYWPPDPLQ